MDNITVIEKIDFTIVIVKCAVLTHSDGMPEGNYSMQSTIAISNTLARKMTGVTHLTQDCEGGIEIWYTDKTAGIPKPNIINILDYDIFYKLVGDAYF